MPSGVDRHISSAQANYIQNRLIRLDQLLSMLNQLCPCDTNPATTDGPMQECPIHGDGTTFVSDVRWLEHIRVAAIAHVTHNNQESQNELVKVLKNVQRH